MYGRILELQSKFTTGNASRPAANLTKLTLTVGKFETFHLSTMDHEGGAKHYGRKLTTFAAVKNDPSDRGRSISTGERKADLSKKYYSPFGINATSSLVSDLDGSHSFYTKAALLRKNAV